MCTHGASEIIAPVARLYRSLLLAQLSSMRASPVGYISTLVKMVGRTTLLGAPTYLAVANTISYRAGIIYESLSGMYRERVP